MLLFFIAKLMSFSRVRKVENLTEEEEDNLQMKKLFPSFRDKDFADLEPPSLEKKKQVSDNESTDTDPNLKLTIDSILEIHKIHSVLTTKHTSANWITPVEPDEPDFTSPFADRLKMFSVLLDSLYSGCDCNMDAELAPALTVGVRLVQAHGSLDEQKKGKHYDFYHDTNIDEVKLCIPLLKSLTKRVMKLLQEWPDHPTLKQVRLT